MRLIVDTNIVIAAIMSPSGTVAQLIFYHLSDSELFAPRYLIEEIERKEKKILTHTSYASEEFAFVKEKLLKKLDLIEDEIITESAWQKAYELTKDVDPKDSVFVALSLMTGIKIWSGDKELIEGLSKNGFEDIIETKTLREKLG